MTDQDDWVGLSDFLASMQFWRLVQQELAPSLGERGVELLLYEAPYLDGDRVRIPNGPANERDSEGVRNHSILQDPEGFSVRTSGLDRANEFTDIVEAWFGNFDLAAKYFLYQNVCTSTYGRLDQTGRRSLNALLKAEGLMSGWASRDVTGPTGHYPTDLYFNSANPAESYMTFNGDTRTSQVITKTFRQINELYAAELGLDRLDIAIPDTTT